MWLSEGRVFQPEGAADAMALRQEYTYVPGTKEEALVATVD